MTSPKHYLRTIASFLVLLLLAPEALEAVKRKRPVSRKAVAGKAARSAKARLRRPAAQRRAKPRPVQAETQPRSQPKPRTQPAPVIHVPVEPIPASSAAFRSNVFAAPVPVADWDYGTPKLGPRPPVEYPVIGALERPGSPPLVLLAQGAAPAPGAAPRPIDTPKPVSAPAPAKQKYAPVPLALGLIGGGQLRDLFKTALGPINSLEDTSGRVIVGPTMQFHWDKYALQIDALYRGYGLRSAGNLLGLGFSNRSTGRTWEFPLLLKRKFNSSEMPFRPFIGAGIAMRYLGQISTISANDNSASEQTTTRQLTFGLPLAAGMEFHLQRFRLSPELRYTLWTADNATPVRTQLFDPNYNQFQLLFGFTF